jgi:hypothetical protein
MTVSIYTVDITGPSAYDTQETLLYKCDKQDEFLDTVTKYMVARYRSYIEEEEEGEDEECMYSDYPQTMTDTVKESMYIAKKVSSCVEFGGVSGDKNEIILIGYTNDTVSLTPKYTNPIESIDISKLFPEIPGKWSDLVAKASKITALIKQTQDEWVETVPTMSRLMLKDKVTGQSVPYGDLTTELHKTGDDAHPLWKRYVGE